MRAGKIPAIPSANRSAVAIPDSATFVLMWFEPDTKRICVKNSEGVVRESVALTVND